MTCRRFDCFFRVSLWSFCFSKLRSYLAFFLSISFSSGIVSSIGLSDFNNFVYHSNFLHFIYFAHTAFQTHLMAVPFLAWSRIDIDQCSNNYKSKFLAQWFWTSFSFQFTVLIFAQQHAISLNSSTCQVTLCWTGSLNSGAN